MASSDFSKSGQAHAHSSRVRLVRSDRPNPFPEYRSLGLVGQGQFAQVYCAIHRQTGRLVAIKQTRHTPEHPSQEPFVLGELCHPNLVCCQAIAQTKEGYQFVLDYCEAGTLRSHIEMNEPSATLSPQRLTQIAIDILKGLCYIHHERVIHGDLKPENILLTYQSQAAETASSRLVARIGDFGSARLVNMPNQSLKEIGSPTYAAPERFDGQSSQFSDLYSAGVVLYELLLGDRPFSGSPDDLRQAHQTQSVPFSKRVPSAIQVFFEQALHKRPEARFSSADEMVDALEKLFCSGAISALEVASSWGKFSQPLTQTIDRERYQSLFGEQSRSELQALSDPLNAEISGKVQQLIGANQQCFITTDRAVYRLNNHREVQPVIQLDRPSRVAVSPDGSWLMTLPKEISQPSGQMLEKVSGQLVHFQSDSKFRRDRPVYFEESLSTQTSFVQTIAIDRRHILKVLVSKQSEKSYLECFTRKGKRIATLSLDVFLSYAALSFEPYQIVAISAANTSKSSRLLIISLRPFQVRSVLLSPKDLCASSRGVSAFPWGFLVIDDGGCLFLDRSACPVGRLDIDGISAIAPVSDGKILVAVSSQIPCSDLPQSSVCINGDPSQKIAFSEGSFALFVVDLRDLGLDLIF